MRPMTSHGTATESNPIHFVRAGEWQAAEPLGAYGMPEETAAKLPEQLRRLV